jgi:hypothetical protein
MSTLTNVSNVLVIMMHLRVQKLAQPKVVLYGMLHILDNQAAMKSGQI